VKLRHLFILSILIFSYEGIAQLKEPTSDPSFEAQAPPTEDAIDDAAEVKLRPSPDKYVESDEDAPKKPAARMAVDTPEPENFSVRRVRLSAVTKVYHGIQLVSPQHNSTYTPGVITFSWKILSPSSSKKKHYVVLKVERLDGKKKYSRRISKEKKLLELSPGDYKWQVASEKPTQESRWRLFKVIEMKSHSITDLYKKAQPKKPVPVVSDYIIDSDGPEEDEDLRLPASKTSPAEAPSDNSQEPLAPPPWTHQTKY